MNTSPDGHADKGYFDQTLWSTILKAKEGGEETRLAALGRLMERYRRPIILQIRQVGRCSEMEAEELAHEFFAHWMGKDHFLESVTPEKGRFRNFIKDCIRNFLIDLHRKGAAKKRKPDEPLQSIDEMDDGGVPVVQPQARGLSPDEEIDVVWARELLAGALADLERECVAARRGRLFLALKPTLGGDPSVEQHAAIAARLGMTEGAVKTAYHRIKQRLGELIREEVKQTVGSQEDWEQELRYLIELLGK